MKTLLRFLTIIFIVVNIVACNDDDKDVPVAFKDVILNEGNTWKKTEYGSVLIINSQENLEECVEGEIKDFPKIDFAKYSVLKVSHSSTSAIGSMDKKLYMIGGSNTKYSLSVDVNLSIYQAVEEYEVVIACPKIAEHATVSFSYTSHPPK